MKEYLIVAMMLAGCAAATGPNGGHNNDEMRLAGAAVSPCSFKILIDPESRTIGAESRATIEHVAALHRRNSSSRIRIYGHSDTSADRAYDVAISSGNAEFVRDELESAGVDPARISTHGFGQEAAEKINLAAASVAMVSLDTCDETQVSQNSSLDGAFSHCEFGIEAYHQVLKLAEAHVEAIVYTSLVMNGINTNYDVIDLAETTVFEAKDELVAAQVAATLEGHCAATTSQTILSPTR